MAEIVQQSKSEAMFRSNLEDIKSRFAILLRSVQSALEANHVTTEDVYAVLIGMFNCGESIPKTNLEEIFTAVTNHRLWDYMHHSPVEKILRRLIPDHIGMIREYKSQLSGFYATTKLIDYISYENRGIESTVDREIDLEHLSVANYQKLKVKLELDRKIDTISLKYVQDLWEEFADEFDIPYLTVVIGEILSGSLQITWLITPDIANKIATAVCDSTFFQNHPNIIYVAVNDTVYYDIEEVTRCKADFKHRLGECVDELDLHVADNDLVNFIEQNVRFDSIKQSAFDSAANMQSYTVFINSNAHFRRIELGHCTRTAIKHEFFTGIPYTGFIAGFIIGFIAGIFAKDIDRMISSGLAGAVAGVFAVSICSAIKGDVAGNFDIKRVRLLTVRLFVVILASSLVGIFDSGAAIGAIGGAFVGSLIADVSNKAVKSVPKTNIFAIALGAIIGTAIGAIGGTIPGTILGAIMAGVVAVVFHKLEAIVRTVLTIDALRDMVKSVSGIIMTVGRGDIKAVVVGIFIGTVLNSLPIGNAALIGAVAGAISCRVSNYISELVDGLSATTNFYSVIFAFILLCLTYGTVAVDLDANGAVGGIVVALYIVLLIVRYDPYYFNMFRDRARFAALAGFFGGVYATILYMPVIGHFSVEGTIPKPVVGSVFIAIAGAAIGGYLLLVVIGIMASDRLVVGLATSQAIQIIAATVKAHLARIVDKSIILGAIGAILGTSIALSADIIVEGRLAGAAVGAILGAVTGTASGIVTIIATAVIREIAIPTIALCTERETKAFMVITTVGGFIGGVIGGYFTSNIVPGCLIGLAFSIATAASFVAVMYIARRQHFKLVERSILVPLTVLVNHFGTAIEQGSQSKWIQHRITVTP